MAARRRNRLAVRARTLPDATRIERDLLGELEIPASALYGIHTVRAVRNLSFSGKTLGHYPHYVAALAIVKKAAARANRDAKVIDPCVCAAIEHTCAFLIRGAPPDQFPVDVIGGGGGIGVNMNINEVIANFANEHLGGKRGAYAPVDPKRHVNASQSTADVCHTAIRIAALDRWKPLRTALGALVSATRAKAVQLRPTITIARTCLQDASPISMGALFGGHAAVLQRRIDELARSIDNLRRINLGGTAVGSGQGAPPAYRRAILRRLNEVASARLTLRDNLYDAAQNIDDLVAACAQLALLAEGLIKIAQDVRLLASGPDGGFAEILLPQVQEGSSFFPGKMNPVVAESLLQCCFMVLGCERTARIALERAELHLNVFEGAAGNALLDAMEMTRRAVTLFTDLCLKGIKADAARCRDLASRARYRKGVQGFVNQ
jgi:aspartate ammonia-lyase